MFSYIKGTIEAKTQNYIILETGGIGYKIFMSQTAIEKLEELGTKKKIYTYMRVREDDVSIYGFITEEELRMFELLLGVSGIGAKGAVSILSNITPSSFALAVITDDVAKIKSLPGIGVKTAQRIILELKDKLKTTSAISEKTEESNNLEKIVEEDSKFAEATAALQVLGYTRKEIEKALNKMDKTLTVEEIIKKEIFKGELLPSSKIPSVRDFALKYQVNPNTMQKALQGLEEEGFIYTVRTSGKYVIDDKEFILKEKRLVAKNLYQDFVNNLKSLGYSDTDIKKILKESGI